jgi:5-hydroxyisourate hydrolase
MGRLTTHVLDTAQGRPGAGIKIDLYSVGTERKRLVQATTNADGRCDKALLEGDGLKAGAYELVFHVGPYFAGNGLKLPEPPFLDEVVIRFSVARPDEHYHVPLLLSPYGYSTYRGS